MSKYKRHGTQDRNIPDITRAADMPQNWDDVIDDERDVNEDDQLKAGDLVVPLGHFVTDMKVSTSGDELHTIRQVFTGSSEYQPGEPNVNGFAHGIYLGKMYIQRQPTNITIGRGWHGKHKFKMLNVYEPIFQFGDIRVIANLDLMQRV